MFTIISIMFVGIGIGYVLRNLQFLQKIEKSTSLTIFPFSYTHLDVYKRQGRWYLHPGRQSAGMYPEMRQGIR